MRGEDGRDLRKVNKAIVNKTGIQQLVFSFVKYFGTFYCLFFIATFCKIGFFKDGSEASVFVLGFELDEMLQLADGKGAVNRQHHILFLTACRNLLSLSGFGSVDCGCFESDC